MSAGKLGTNPMATAASQSRFLLPSLFALSVCGFLTGCSREVVTTVETCSSIIELPTSWWSGSKVSDLSATDFVDAKNNGSLDPLVSLSSGKFSTAFTFSGSTSSINIPNSSSLNMTNAMSLSAWVKSNLNSRASNTVQTILSKWGFQDSSAFNPSSGAGGWQGVNLGASSILGSQTGFQGITNGGVFDGRYVYIVANGGSAFMMRYDTQGVYNPTSGPGGWESVLITPIFGTRPGYQAGWTSATFDGRYVYFIPVGATNSQSGFVLRYDTRGVYSPTSGAGGWEAVNIADSSILGARPGYAAGFSSGSGFDGRYIYFNSFNSASNGFVVRYDTQAEFNPTGGAGGWQSVDIMASSVLGAVAGSTAGFQGYVFDGHYMYLVPFGSLSNSGFVVRYDTRGEFNPSSGAGGWSGVNIGSSSILGSVSGYQGGFVYGLYDGRYVYFGPRGAGVTSGFAVRYDTQAEFNPTSGAGGWEGVDIGSSSILGSQTGYHGGFVGLSFDGRYVYYAPRNNINGANTFVVRFDTQGAFKPTSGAGGWQGVDVKSASILGSQSGNLAGFQGTAFDGRYIYILPRNGGNYTIRFDTTGNQASYALKYSDFGSDGFSSSLPGSVFTINTSNGPLNVRSETSIPSGDWHHIAATYDSTLLSLYIDGTLVASQPGSGSINQSTSDVSIGKLTGGAGYFNGSMEHVQLYNRTLSASDILKLSTCTP